MTEDQLLPAWSYELAAVLEVLSVLLVQGAEVGVLEEKITEVISLFSLCLDLQSISIFISARKQNIVSNV